MRSLPLALLSAFVLADLAANWRLLGMVSVSEQVWALGWPGRITAAIVMVVLAAHLGLKWPYGSS